MKPTPCKNCKKMATKTQVIRDDRFNKMLAFVGADPKDFAVNIRSVNRGSNWDISITIENVSAPDIAPITIQIT